MTATPSPSATPSDPLADLDAAERATLSAVADRLIPAAHGMPSAADVLGDDRLRFVLNARPDLGDDVQGRLDALGRDEPATLGALQLVIVAGYYTDRGVRDLIGYPGQMALELRSWEYPVYLEEGLIDAVLARGQVWRDPATGQRATAPGAPRTYAERWTTDTGSPEGGHDGRDRT